jgi:hypothetical protein
VIQPAQTSVVYEAGSTEVIPVQVVDRDGNVVPGAQITAYSSLADSIITVNMTEAGLVIDVHDRGDGLITLTAPDAWPVEVRIRTFIPIFAMGWEVYPNWAALRQGSETDLSFRIFDQFGADQLATYAELLDMPEDFTIEATSADPGIVAVDEDGYTLIAVSEGQTTVTLQASGSTPAEGAFVLDPFTLNLTVRAPTTHEGMALYTYDGEDYEGAVSVQTAVHIVDGWADASTWGWPMTWVDEGSEIYIDDVAVWRGEPRTIMWIWPADGESEFVAGETYDMQGVWRWDTLGANDTGYQWFDDGISVTITAIGGGRVHGTFSGGHVGALDVDVGPAEFILLDLDYEDSDASAAAFRTPEADRMVQEARELRRSLR